MCSDSAGGARGEPLVSVIIPTVCTTERGAGLRRALQSAERQSYRRFEVVLCVNGPAVDERLLADLECDSLRIVRKSVPSLHRAIIAGREAVAGDCFCYLDDDDALLPNSLEHRVRALQADAELAAVSSNGYVEEDDRRRLLVAEGVVDPADLFGSLLRKNWNASCGALFRTSMFAPEFFEGSYADGPGRRWFLNGVVDRGFSWTFLTAKMCLQRKVGWLDEPLFTIHRSAGTTSQSEGAMLRPVAVWHSIRSLGMPGRYRKEWGRKVSRAHHRAAQLLLQRGRRSEAMRHHLASLTASAWGLRFAPYTRFFVRRGTASRN